MHRDKDLTWEEYASLYWECQDCGIALTDSKVRHDPYCWGCGRTYDMSE